MELGEIMNNPNAIVNRPFDVAEHVRRSVSAGPSRDPIVQYQSNLGEGGKLSIGLRTSLLGEEMDLIEERVGVNILEVAAHDAEYFRQNPESDEVIELILHVVKKPLKEE